MCRSRTKILKIYKLRPYEEIPANRIKKQLAYEEFWMTDFELAHLNGQEKDVPIGEIKMNGLGISPAPSLSNPIVFQAGRRSAIDEFINNKAFAHELTAVMY